MKKSKLTLGLMSGLVGMMALAACSGPVYSPKGNILTYTDSTGASHEYTAKDLFGSYYSDASSVSTMFDCIYKLIVRNYFVVESKGVEKFAEIKKNAQNDVEGVKSKANQNAQSNGTSYDVEFDALLKSNGCKDEAELLEHFIYTRELKEFEEQFYDENTAHLRDSKPGVGDGYEGYLYKKAPYHVRHILAKVSDSGSKNYWNGTITEDNARLLNDIATELAAGDTSFGTIAKEYSDDTSATSYGDLGIMDKDTSFVNEFKLGMYAFENLYNGATSASAATSSIAMNADIKASYEDAVNTTVSGIKTTETGIGQIPYEAFLKLEEYAAVVADENNSPVNKGNENYFPRNVVYNKYLNKHSVAVIVPNSVNTGTVTSEGKVENEDDFGTYSATYAALPGFRSVTGLTVGNGSHNEVLTTTTGNPILVVRAGADSYQGIHFMTIERTPLIEEVNGVKLSDYYTTYYPGQEEYPTADGKDLQTYVNFIEAEKKDYKTRAEEVEGKVKSFDSTLNKYIFGKYVESEKIKFNDEKLSEAINNWIESAKAKFDFDAMNSWNETWDSYINSLKQQAVIRQQLISEACAIGYLSATKDAKLWDTIGGACNDNTQK